jgi:hypothetical protein
LLRRVNMVAPVLLLVTLLGIQSRPALNTSILIENWRVIVTVHPSDRRTVKTVTLKPDKKAKNTSTLEPVPPHTRVTLPKGAVRVTFDPPPTAFHVVVTLDDGSVHRVDKPTRPNSYTVAPLEHFSPIRPAKG